MKSKIILSISAFFLISNIVFAADGKLRIKADMSGASIFINGDYKGSTKEGQYTNFLLPSGEYKVTVQKKTDPWDYRKKKTINLPSGKALRVSFELDKYASKKQQNQAKQAMKKSNTKYTDNGNGTVTDKTTGLMWKKCSEGQTWDGSTCTGKAEGYNYQAALDHAGDVNFAGHFDWRVPTIKELNSLVFCSNGKQRKFHFNGFFVKWFEGGYGCKSNIRGNYETPTINQTFFPNTPADYFWSSSPNASYASDARRLNFNYGSDGSNNRGNGYRVRLVRLGQ